MIRTYIPVERRPNCDNVALHEIICVMSMDNEWNLSSESKASFDQNLSGRWQAWDREIGSKENARYRNAWSKLQSYIQFNRFFCALLQRFFPLY